MNGRHDNYPDDIHMYDHDPRSPFYVAPPAECECCFEQFDADDLDDDGYCDECVKHRREEAE